MLGPRERDPPSVASQRPAIVWLVSIDLTLLLVPSKGDCVLTGSSLP